MCLDTKHYRCCCCSLTTATYIFGVLQIIALIAYAIQGNWTAAALQAGISACYVAFFIKPESACVRKLVFLVQLIGQIIELVVITIVTFMAASAVDALEDAAAESAGTQSQSAGAKMIWILYAVVAIIIVSI